jgi:hypothetical protein
MPVIVPRYAEDRASPLLDIIGKQIFIGLGVVEDSDHFVDEVFRIFDQFSAFGAVRRMLTI